MVELEKAYRRTVNEADKLDGYMYTIEIRLEKITRTELDALFKVLVELPDVKQKHFSRAALAPEQKTSI